MTEAEYRNLYATLALMRLRGRLGEKARRPMGLHMGRGS